MSEYFGYINDTVRIGVRVDYNHNFTSSNNTFRYLMVGATPEIDLVSNLYIGSELGYAFKVDPWTLQTHYFTPKLGYRFSNNINLYVNYNAVRFTRSQAESVGLGL